MFSSISYYAMFANLLYTFNLVNYPELNAIKNQLYEIHEDRITQDKSLTGLNLEYTSDLINSKVEPKLFKLSFFKGKQLPQIPEHDIPSSSIAQILLWLIVVYFVSIRGNRI